MRGKACVAEAEMRWTERQEEERACIEAKMAKIQARLPAGCCITDFCSNGGTAPRQTPSLHPHSRGHSPPPAPAPCAPTSTHMAPRGCIPSAPPSSFCLSWDPMAVQQAADIIAVSLMMRSCRVVGEAREG